MIGPIEIVENWMDRHLPVADECADIHHGLAGVMVTLSAVCGEQALETIERHAVAADPITFAGNVAVTAVAATAAGFFWNRGWRSRGE